MYERYSNRKIGVCKEDAVWTEKHTGGIHENGGRCTICNYQYQQHTTTNNIVGYDTNRN